MKKPVRCAIGFAALVCCVLISHPALSGDDKSVATTSVPVQQAYDFKTHDLWIDSGSMAVAAYQVEITYDAAIVKIAGIEGGEPSAYTNAPYYDRKGFEGGRIVVAALTTDEVGAPSGSFRAARIHVAATKGQDAVIGCRLMAAATPGGERISPTVKLVKRDRL